MQHEREGEGVSRLPNRQGLWRCVHSLCPPPKRMELVLKALTAETVDHRGATTTRAARATTAGRATVDRARVYACLAIREDIVGK